MMHSLNVLFTSAGRRVELLRAFRRAYVDLGLDGTILAADHDALAPALREADRQVLVPAITDPEYIPTLTEVCRKYRVDLVFPLIDPEIPLLSEHRAELEAAGTRVVVVPEHAARAITDKLLTDRLFRDLGVPTPTTWTADEARSSRLDFPVFVKSRSGSAGEHAEVARERRQLELLLDYTPDPIVQAFVDGPEITSDVVCDLDGDVLAVVSRRRIAVRSGEVSKGVTVADPRILDRCVAIAHRVEAIGPITVQCLLAAEEPCFTEVNARFAGGVPLAIAAGAPVVHWLLARIAGLEMDIPPLGTYRVGVYLSRFDDSLFVSQEELADAERHRL